MEHFIRFLWDNGDCPKAVWCGIFWTLNMKLQKKYAASYIFIESPRTTLTHLHSHNSLIHLTHISTDRISIGMQKSGNW